MQKIYIVTDLGPGDGGKGGVVHKISHLKKAHTIFKVGGAQGSHGVTTSSGEQFAFSQFGCGTFEGVRTHLTPRFIFSPEGILNEGYDLRYRHGIDNVFELLTVDENVICATPFHGIASRIKELARKNNPRGTIGTGVGEAFRFSKRFSDLTIRAKDLSSSKLKNRLAAIRDQVKTDLEPLIDLGFLSSDISEALTELELLDDPEFLEHVTNRFKLAAKEVRIVDSDYFSYLLAQDGVTVVESSHGILTDHYQGFHPHTSAIRTLPSFTKEMIEEHGYDGEMINLGVHRAYTIRHGAGPMPTTDDGMNEHLLPGSHKLENRYQGKVRVGPLDLVLLRYAIAASGGPTAFDGLAISWFDQMLVNGSWWLCNKYINATNQTYFTPEGELKVRFGHDDDQLQYQQQLGQELEKCTPELSEQKIASGNLEAQYNLCAETLYDALNIKVRMVSFGKTERDKVCR